ncbi:hypothetical protein N7463_007421 [Penicillium fimorum]|uniref:Uncharacterized protein n=1 Tax=Penicillium fimorum TaxID=1882269 RepID=A0A9X0C742_9EURO|nr:hypothetical protein N7463_007421 [Penicillium fimorum]
MNLEGTAPLFGNFSSFLPRLLVSFTRKIEKMNSIGGDPSAPLNPPPGPGSSINGLTSRQRKRLKEKRRRLRKASPKKAAKAAEEHAARVAELYSRAVQAQANVRYPLLSFPINPNQSSSGVIRRDMTSDEYDLTSLLPPSALVLVCLAAVWSIWAVVAAAIVVVTMLSTGSPRAHQRAPPAPPGPPSNEILPSPTTPLIGLTHPDSPHVSTPVSLAIEFIL